ncbi:MAG TPA: hypothetical protein VE223_08455 [Nitrososphaeraceae archaeon]|nr:hypothetical protein [Nitrososphaeraceae archaeon]
MISTGVLEDGAKLGWPGAKALNSKSTLWAYEFPASNSADIQR